MHPFRSSNLLLLFAVTLLLRVSAARTDPQEGSGGDADGDEESYYDLENEAETDQVPPRLQNKPSSEGTLPTSSREDSITEDSIYIEDGSGEDSHEYEAPSSTSSTSQYTPPNRQPPPPPPPPSYYPGQGSEPVSRISNTPPQLQRKLKKVPVTAGKSLRWKIPEDTFFDQEEGTTSKLRLSLRQQDGSRIKDVSWVRFDENTQVLYLLPVDENDIGRWRFQVVAHDRHGQSAQDTLEIVVRQYSGSRLVNHQFEIQFSFVKWNAQITQSWKWRFLDTLRRFYKDPNAENIVVRRATDNPFSFAWTNSSLVQPQCSKEDILKLYESMTQPGHHEEKPSSQLRNIFGDEIVLQAVKLNYFGACLDDAYPDRDISSSDNNVPVVRNPIDVINITAGEYLQFKVPKDTCYDEEDGETTRLSLQLLTMNRKELASNSWLYFDSRNQEFIGIPLSEEVGREEYQLVRVQTKY